MSSFSELDLTSPILKALDSLGYETPTPIQEQAIRVLLEKRDLLAQAQTGTGKTAAFALPILCQLDLGIRQPQALVIAPTRELAIQVAEAFQAYASQMKEFSVTPIYGGQDFRLQLKALQRGVHVIVGTPGRVMDHLRRGTINMDHIQTVILDEADEMLKMGFIDDVEWILSQIEKDHQTGLFSATMPAQVEKIAQRYLKDAERISISPQQKTLDNIEQFYYSLQRNQKLEVLTRFLEVEHIDAAIIFARTRTQSAELAEKLKARGYRAAALNGDMSQSLRQKVIEQIKSGKLDIIVATDVAARGIDVERVSHVINYDIPHDIESYVHRIGRTGRAGRQGKALLMISPRENRLLRDIEKSIQQRIPLMDPPTLDEINLKRNQTLCDKLMKVMSKKSKFLPYSAFIDKIMAEHNVPAEDIAAAFAYLMNQSNPTLNYEIKTAQEEKKGRSARKKEATRKSSSDRKPKGRPRRDDQDKPSYSKSQRQKPFEDKSSEYKTSKKPFKKRDEDGDSHRKPRRSFSESEERRPRRSSGFDEAPKRKPRRSFSESEERRPRRNSRFDESPASSSKKPYKKNSRSKAPSTGTGSKTSKTFSKGNRMPTSSGVKVSYGRSEFKPKRSKKSKPKA